RVILLFFFFQAEDGIRDRNVTGVQTCALPICILMTILKFGLFLVISHFLVLLKTRSMKILPKTYFKVALKSLQKVLICHVQVKQLIYLLNIYSYLDKIKQSMLVELQLLL